MVSKEGRKQALVNLDLNTKGKIRLAKNNPVGADADLVVGDFTQCDFDGYAQQTPTFGAVSIDGDGLANATTGIHTFTAGAGIAAPQTIRAVLLVLDDLLGGGYKLLDFQRLDPPVTLATPGEQFQRIYKFQATNYEP